MSAICELTSMDMPSNKQMCVVAGISKGYASDIRVGRQVPSRRLAIHLYHKTGWRHPSIAALSDEQMRVLESVEPWIPTAQRDAARAGA